MKGPAIERALTVMTDAEKTGNAKAIFLSGSALRQLMLGRLYASKFLDSSDAKAAERARTELAAMQSNLNDLAGADPVPEHQPILAAARETGGDYLKASTK